MATHILTAQVIDFNAAREARKARPFRARILKSVAARTDRDQLATMRVAVADGFASGLTTGQITRSIRRDQVEQKARAAL